uniref:Apple domain-containing protein n=1 Tax=Salix viminalis TaxID=40686 RepID=A0A6N2M5T2_SALVM
MPMCRSRIRESGRDTYSTCEPTDEELRVFIGMQEWRRVSEAVWLDMDMSHADCERECKRNCSCSAYARLRMRGNQMSILRRRFLPHCFFSFAVVGAVEGRQSIGDSRFITLGEGMHNQEQQCWVLKNTNYTPGVKTPELSENKYPEVLLESSTQPPQSLSALGAIVQFVPTSVSQFHQASTLLELLLVSKVKSSRGNPINGSSGFLFIKKHGNLFLSDDSDHRLEKENTSGNWGLLMYPSSSPQFSLLWRVQRQFYKVDHSGFLKLVALHASDHKWKEFWAAPKHQCDWYGKRGAYSTCHPADITRYECACHACEGRKSSTEKQSKRNCSRAAYAIVITPGRANAALDDMDN